MIIENTASGEHKQIQRARITGLHILPAEDRPTAKEKQGFGIFLNPKREAVNSIFIHSQKTLTLRETVRREIMKRSG